MAGGQNTGQSNKDAVELLIALKATQDSIAKIMQQTREAMVDGTKVALEDDRTIASVQKFATKWAYAFKGGVPDDIKDPNVKAGLQLTGEASKASDRIADDIMKIMKTGIGIIEDIHTRIKQASPLLQSVESLFNLAMQLFFMPLGNKLAEVMIPAIIELVNNVVDMWDKIEGMDLGDMLTAMVDYGVKIFGQYFTSLGETLSEQGGLIGAIGHILTGLGDFVENHLADLIEVGVGILQFVLDNFGTLLNLFIEFKIASIALQTAQVAATISSSLGPFGALIGGVAGFTAVEAAGNAIAGSAGVFDATSKMNNRAASGAYVGATEGGRDVTVAEGGEGEFILPESRLQTMMDTVSDRMVDIASGTQTEIELPRGGDTVINNNFYINGYTDRELKDIIKQTANEQISQARLRSGF